MSTVITCPLESIAYYWKYIQFARDNSKQLEEIFTKYSSDLFLHVVCKR